MAADEPTTPPSGETPAPAAAEATAAPAAPETAAAGDTPATEAAAPASPPNEEKPKKRQPSVREIENALLKMPLEKRILDRLDNLRKDLIINEDLMMSSVFRGDVNIAYYKRWRKDANLLHKAAVKYKRRLKKIRNKEIA